MQPANWNDLRDLLAIKRGRTLSSAARQLCVDDTTAAGHSWNRNALKVRTAGPVSASDGQGAGSLCWSRPRIFEGSRPLITAALADTIAKVAPDLALDPGLC
jgi:hypothetical protein